MSDDYDWSKHLKVGEEVLWQGRPDGRFRMFLRDADYVAVPIALVFFSALLSLALAGELAGLLCVLFAYTLFVRPVFDQILRRNLRYAVTNARILRANRSFGLMDRIDITSDLKMDVILGRFTTIRFNHAIRHGLRSRLPGDPFGMNTAIFEAMLLGYVEPGPEFRRISDGKEVARLLKNLRDSGEEIALA